MGETRFTCSISGEVRFAYNGAYPYFMPNMLPFELDIPRSIYRSSLDAIIALSNLNGRVSGMTAEERTILTRAFTMKESVHSSSIEGTHSTLSDLYRSEKDMLDITMERDAKEVTNYMDALRIGLDRISDGGEIDIDLLHEMHRALMSGTRGDNKSPGEFKKEQNAIGRPEDTLDTAEMVPAPPEAVERLMDNLLDFIGYDEDPLIKIALIHYQFKVIHPYRDGNGRIGRLLIMLLLAKEGLLRYPAIYLSGYFDRNRERYIDGLFAVSTKDSFPEWFGFFITAMKEQAEDSMRMIQELQQYRMTLAARYGQSAHKSMAVGMLFVNPYIRSKDVAEGCGISAGAAIGILSSLEDDGIIREITGRSRRRTYVADGILDILMRR